MRFSVLDNNLVKRLAVLSAALFVTTWSLFATAEYTRVVADCRYSDGTNGQIQIWFTYLSAVGTPANDYDPKQVVYHLVFMGAGGNSQSSPVLVLRGSPDLDSVSNDGLLKNLSLIAPDGSREMRLKLVINNQGKSAGTAQAQYLSLATRPKISLLVCGNLQPLLFQLDAPPAY